MTVTWPLHDRYTTVTRTLQVEVVLAYKGAIFGSLIVYIFPALMRTALALQTHGAAGGAGGSRVTGHRTTADLFYLQQESGHGALSRPLVDADAGPPGGAVGAVLEDHVAAAGSGAAT